MEKRESRVSEVLKFLISGGICFLVKLVCSVVLRFGLGHGTWLSVLLAELVAIAVNYILCVLWIWPAAKDNTAVTKIGFLITSLIGLLWNELLMMLFGTVLGEKQVLLTVLGKGITMYMINICLTTAIVLFWNYFTKRAVLNSDMLKKWAEKVKNESAEKT